MNQNNKNKISSHYLLLLLIWIAVFIIALAWLLRPEQEMPIPSGWQRYPQTGAVYTLIPYEDGVLAGGVRGLWYSDGSTTISFAPSELPEGVMVVTLTNTPDRGLWVGHSEGLSVFQKGEWQHWNSSDGLPKPPIQSIALDHEGGWIAGTDGLIRFRGDLPKLEPDKTRILPNDNFAVQKMKKLLLDRNNNLWIGTSESPGGGIFLLSGKEVIFWGHAEGLPHPQVTSIMEDHHGRIWVGTGFHNRGGAAIFEQTSQGWKLKSTLLENELAGPKVRSLAQDNQGYYWIGSENNGLAVRDEKRIITILRKEQGLPGLEVTDIVQTQDASIWLATLKGLVRIDANTLSHLIPLKQGAEP